MPLNLVHMEETFEILDSVQGKVQTFARRRCLSIELAAKMLCDATHRISVKEKKRFEQFSRLAADPAGKTLLRAVTDISFRCANPHRIADQIIYLLDQLGVPAYLPWNKRARLHGLRVLGPKWARHLVLPLMNALIADASHLIYSNEIIAKNTQTVRRVREENKCDLVRLQESISSDRAAERHLLLLFDDLSNPKIKRISIKLSSLISHFALSFPSELPDLLIERFRLLLRASSRSTHITIDMENYEKFSLTLTLFQKVLDEPEFHQYTAGITLQAYLPDSFHAQKELTEWAKKRVHLGRPPITIRIVKGAYLTYEQVESSRRNWPLPTYMTKLETDANFKRMVAFACERENAQAVHVEIGTHNIFDIAYSLILRSEMKVENQVRFAMLKGVFDPIQHSIQNLTGDLILYCPIATQSKLSETIAYLFRRLEESSSADNFLHYAYDIHPGTDVWNGQIKQFIDGYDEMNNVFSQPRRTQNRHLRASLPAIETPFDNEPDTDFMLIQNQTWTKEIVDRWKTGTIAPVPISVNGCDLFVDEFHSHKDPSQPEKIFYQHSFARKEHLQKALACAEKHQKDWSAHSVDYRVRLFAKFAQIIRERRGDFIGVLMGEGAMNIKEADAEVSQVIDYAEYYRQQLLRIHSMLDVVWRAKGSVLVISPSASSCAFAAHGLLNALIAGNCVLFRPSRYGIGVGWLLVNALWDSGVPKEVIQFIPCDSRDIDSDILNSPLLNAVIFAGSTANAKQLLRFNPALSLFAETGRKNSMIISSLSDRDHAIKTLLQSAFCQNGQKASCASIAILEAEVYDDPHFFRDLQEAALSLKTGSAWDLSSHITPLVKNADKMTLRGLTTLESQEKWLLQPKQNPLNSQLWSPGIKIHVLPNQFTHLTEFQGPLLGIMRAESLTQAIALANRGPYGLAAGLMSLDDREHTYWMNHIHAGSCSINCEMTTSVVKCHPFGGMKESCWGREWKIGGPNVICQLLTAQEVGLPQEKLPINDAVNALTTVIDKINLTAEELGIWYASIANYAYWWKRLSQLRDPIKLVGQDNYFRYLPRKGIALRLEKESELLDALRVSAAALTVGAELEVSYDRSDNAQLFLGLHSSIHCISESCDEFQKRIRQGKIQRIRYVSSPPRSVITTASQSGVYIIDASVLSNGRFELLHYLHEQSITIEYHRHGNLGVREDELRKSTT